MTLRLGALTLALLIGSASARAATPPPAGTCRACARGRPGARAPGGVAGRAGSAAAVRRSRYEGRLA
jgi:hypothetical protein